MRRTTVIASALLLITAGFAMAAPGKDARRDVVGRFSARSVELTSPVRLSFRHVDIVINQWSTDQDHRLLARTVLEKGPVAFLDVLSGYPSMGTISVAGNRDITIRYAWQAADRDGGQRIYLATNEPISLTSSEFRKFQDADPLTFIELRVNARGDGLGKLSDAVRLSADESRNVIEMREFDRRALHLLMVHDELNIYD